jgi:hypothetical protein
MNPTDQLSFAVSDRIDDVEVSPSRVPLSLLGEFQSDVAEFVRGSKKDVKTNDVFVSIEPGSVKFVTSGLIALTALWSDVSTIERTKSISFIDKARAEVIQRWQVRAEKYPNRTYTLSDASGNLLIKVNSETNFHVDTDIWINVERYMLGTITDMGGINKPNIHFVLNSGMPLVVATDKSKIAKEDRNWIYREALLHVKAEENLSTGELRKVTLLNFEEYDPQYNDADFLAMTLKGEKAWADVPDASAWVDEIRGNN